MELLFDDIGKDKSYVLISDQQKVSVVSHIFHFYG